jgi:hypothetical protein
MGSSRVVSSSAAKSRTPAVNFFINTTPSYLEPCRLPLHAPVKHPNNKSNPPTHHRQWHPNPQQYAPSTAASCANSPPPPKQHEPSTKSSLHHLTSNSAYGPHYQHRAREQVFRAKYSRRSNSCSMCRRNGHMRRCWSGIIRAWA